MQNAVELLADMAFVLSYLKDRCPDRSEAGVLDEYDSAKPAQ